MKTIHIYTSIISTILLVVGLESYAQTLPSAGTWEATTITQDQTINLTGKISLIGCITVDNGAKLVIRNTGSSKNIFNEIDMSTELDHMFVIKGGATLEIDGGSNGITLGGGASFNVDNVQYDDFGCIKDTTSFGTPVRTMSSSAIFNQDGSLSLNKVTIQNVCINSSDYDKNDQKVGASGTIRHQQGTTTIKNCTIKLCKGWTGAGIFANPSSKGEITIENTTFQHCINTITYHSTHGGTIRAWGTSSVHLNLTNVTVHHCFSQVDAAALYWPANGKNSDGRFATLTFDGCEFYNNKAHTQNGGALDLCGTVQFVNNITKVHDNIAATYGGGISIRPYNSGSPAAEALKVVYDVTDKLDVYDNTAQKGGGIAFYSGYDGSTLPSGTSFEINLNGASVHENHAIASESGNGGGIWLRNDYSGPDFSFTFNMNKGSVYKNTASQDGGGVYLYGWKLVSSDKQGDILKIYDNNATASGGGLFINVGSDYTMNNGQIYGNTADTGGGGGVYMRSGNFTMNQGEVSLNTSAMNGGGLLIQNGEIQLNNGTISGNSASNSGGGICNTGGGNITMNGGTISNNTAIKNGGGIANAGNGTIEIEGGTISFNRADSRGGGLYNSGSGNITVNGGSISDNNAGYDGGAFYSSDGEVVVDGGEFNKNEAAHHGGGVFVLGGNILFKNGKLTNNTAVNGGGIFLASGTSMTFTDGLIAGNKAVENGNEFHTAYNAKAASINMNGCGGGVYLRSGTADKKTALTINVVNNFGLYGNTADRAGDDIVAEGVNTSVTVPNVTAMDLKDFEGKDAQPNWYEDYVYYNNASDSQYDAHSILKYSGGSGKRFKDMLFDGSGDFYNHLVTFSETSRTYSDYVCLSLGYTVLSAIIRATGLNEKENMYFTLEQLVKPDGASEWTVKNTYPVLVIGTKEASAQRVVRNLMPGQYRVKQFKAGDTPWAWAYTVTDPSAGVIEKLVTKEDGENNLFPFTVQHIEGDENVLHDEEYKVNKMLDNAAIVPGADVEDMKKKEPVHVKF